MKKQFICTFSFIIILFQPGWVQTAKKTFIKIKDVATQTETIKKQKIATELKEALDEKFEEMKQQKITNPFIKKILNYTELMKALPEEKLFPIFDTIISEDNDYHFLSEQQIPKLYQMIKNIYPLPPRHCAIFLTNTHDSVEIDLYQKQSFFFVFIPKEIVFAFSDQELQNLCYYALAAKASPKKLKNKTSQLLINNIKKVKNLFKIPKIKTLITLTSTLLYFFPKTMLTLLAGTGTFLLSKHILTKTKLTNLVLKYEREADRVSVQFQNPENLISHLNYFKKNITSKFNQYKKEHLFLVNVLNTLKNQFPQKIDELKRCSLNKLEAIEKEKNYILDGGQAHPSIKERINLLKQ